MDQGSIAAAARNLNLTPATVAQRLRALETEIGCALVARSGRTVSPTEAGYAILDRARTLTRDVRDLQAVASGNEPVGELRVGANSTAVSGLLPPVLSTLSNRYPAIKATLRRDHSSALYEQVLDRRVDVAMITEPNFALPKACAWREIRCEPLVLITPKKMAVSTPKTALRTQPFIRYNQGRWGRANIANYLRDIGVRPEAGYELDSLDAIAIMVSSGLGVSLIPGFRTAMAGRAAHRQDADRGPEIPAPHWDDLAAGIRPVAPDPRLRRRVFDVFLNGEPSVT